MGKKIVLAIFGGIALVGVLLMITGFALGGRVTNMLAENGRIVLDTGSEKIDAGAAPFWMTNFSNLIYWADHHVAYETGTAHAPGTLHAAATEDVATAAGPAVASAAAAPEGTAVPLPFSKADVKKIDIDIGAGYVIITEGTEFSLTVNGPISYTSDFSGGEWELTSDPDIDRLRTEFGHGRFGSDMPRFYDNGRDVTTEFYITVPKGNYELGAEIGIGYLSANGLDVQQLHLMNSMGQLVCGDTKADVAEFETDLGNSAITGFFGRVCELKVNLGHITFAGEATEEFKAESELGSIEAVVPRPADYGWSMEADLGHVSLDGTEASGLSSANTGNTGAKPFFDLKSGLGSVEVTFASAAS